MTITDIPTKIEYDLQAIVTHEVGHFIGIAHSPDPSAVMYASYPPGSISQRTLTPDDVGAVCEIYPPKSGVVCDSTPRGGFTATCDDPPSSSGCAVAGSEDTNASFAFSTMLGLGLLAMVRLVRRSVSRESA